MPTDIAVHVAPGFPLFSEIAIVGPILDRRPLLPRVPSAVISEVPCSCDRLAYHAPALNTPHPNREGFIFTGDTGHQTDEIDDTLTFTRTWANIPPAWDDYSSIAYTFPGYKFNDGFNFLNRGNPRPLTVTARLARAYFAVGPGQTYATPRAIPVITRQRYILTYGLEGDSDVDYVLFSGAAGFETAPTAPAYQALVAASTEIVAEDSTLEQYAGNIWCRVTPYVVAQ